MKSPADKRLLIAEWVAPMSAPMIRDGAVVISNDRILEIGPAARIRTAYPEAESRELGPAVILPGLINSHAHLELSGCAAGEPPDSFVDWILAMPRRTGREPNQGADETFARATRRGIEQCLRFGVTTIGDISQQMHVTRPIVRQSPLRAISYGEVIGLGKRRSRFEELLPRAIDVSMRSERLHIGLTPHSPYTLEPEAIERCVRVARERRLPLAMHLAEIPEEREFLNSHAGPLKDMWEQIGFWEDFAGRFDGSPIAFADAVGVLDEPAVLAHVNYCDEDDLRLLSRGRASVVYCPRTHRYFSHPPHRWREMLDHGINVAIGTDSCASSPDLNLVDDLRLVHQIAPDFPADLLWQMVTTRAARALSFERAGALQAGNFADLVVFDVNTADPLTEILESNQLPRQVWIGGHQLPNSGG